MRTHKRVKKQSSVSCGAFSFPPGPIFSPAVCSWRILPRRWHLNALAEERRWAITAAEKLSLTSFHSPACCQTRWQLWRRPTWCFVFFFPQEFITNPIDSFCVAEEPKLCLMSFKSLQSQWQHVQDAQSIYTSSESCALFCWEALCYLRSAGFARVIFSCMEGGNIKWVTAGSKLRSFQVTHLAHQDFWPEFSD